MSCVPDAVLSLRNRDAIVAALEEAGESEVSAAVIPERGLSYPRVGMLNDVFSVRTLWRTTE